MKVRFHPATPVIVGLFLFALGVMLGIADRMAESFDRMLLSLVELRARLP